MLGSQSRPAALHGFCAAPSRTATGTLADRLEAATFGTISALFGLNAGIIDGTQFSLLITVVVGSALIPTAIAQTFFHPIADLERRGRPVAAEEYV
jgi:hypothetical protein